MLKQLLGKTILFKDYLANRHIAKVVEVYPTVLTEEGEQEPKLKVVIENGAIEQYIEMSCIDSLVVDMNLAEQLLKPPTLATPSTGCQNKKCLSYGHAFTNNCAVKWKKDITSCPEVMLEV